MLQTHHALFLLHLMKKFDRSQTLRNNSQQHATTMQLLWEKKSCMIEWNLTTVDHRSKDVLLLSRSNSCIVSLVYLYSVKTGIEKIETRDFNTVELC